MAIGLIIDAYVESWLIDLGVSFHMKPHKDWFETYHEGHYGKVFLGDSYHYDVVGRGTIRVRMEDGILQTISNVSHVLGLMKNLILVGQFIDESFKANFYMLVNNEMILIYGIIKGSFYKLDAKLMRFSGATIKKNSFKMMLWHKRMAHISKRSLKDMYSKQLVHGLEDKKFDTLDFYESCIMGK